jgi:ABC-type polysaccharide/polyol phosphate export permease
MLGMAWNGPLMKRVRIPKSIFAVASVLSGMVNLLLSLVPLAAIMIVLGAPIRPSVLFLPVSLLILALFTFGVSLGLSIVAVYFADVKEMYQVGIMAVMYLTPIFYPLEIVPPRFAWIVRANPLHYLVRIVRDPIYAGRIPEARDLAFSALWAVGAMVVGWLAFRRLAPDVYPHL